MKLTPMKAIRAKCLDCCCNSAVEVRLCELKTCPLYPYKNGHRPKEDTEGYNIINKDISPPDTHCRGSFRE